MHAFKKFAACLLHAVFSIVDKPFLVQCIVKKFIFLGQFFFCGDTQTTIIQLMSNWAAGTGIASLNERTLVSDKPVSNPTPLDIH